MTAELVTKDPQISFGAWIYLSRHAVPKFELRPARDHPMLGWGQVCRITDGVITAAWPDRGPLRKRKKSYVKLNQRLSGDVWRVGEPR